MGRYLSFSRRTKERGGWGKQWNVTKTRLQKERPYLTRLLAGTEAKTVLPTPIPGPQPSFLLNLLPEALDQD